MNQPTRKRGVSTLIVALYGVLAFAATGRASYELIAKFYKAPLAYSLSAASALIYIVATIALARHSRVSQRIALVTISVELIGVIVVGTLSIFTPDVFPRSTVWSWYGVSYGWFPLIMPIVGLLWLLKQKRQA
ncbi:MAG: hypothetical protein RLZZ471_1133 [Actinomycetota bacterium]